MVDADDLNKEGLEELSRWYFSAYLPFSCKSKLVGNVRELQGLVVAVAKNGQMGLLVSTLSVQALLV